MIIFNLCHETTFQKCTEYLLCIRDSGSGVSFIFTILLFSKISTISILLLSLEKFTNFTCFLLLFSMWSFEMGANMHFHSQSHPRPNLRRGHPPMDCCLCPLRSHPTPPPPEQDLVPSTFVELRGSKLGSHFPFAPRRLAS